MSERSDPLIEEARRTYARPRGEFIAARKARAAELKAAGETDLAAAVLAFPKPSAAADAINGLGRDEPALLGRILSLGRAFRSAQTGADRAAIRALGRDRNRLLSDISAALTAEKPSSATLEEIRRTVLAAVADAGAAEAVRSGRLIRALSADGISAVDLTDAVAGPPIAPPAPSDDGGPAPVDTSLSRRRAERALQAAEKAARSSDDARAEAETQERDARDALDDARAAVTAAEQRFDAARAATKQANRDARAAADALRDARDALDGLTNR